MLDQRRRRLVDVVQMLNWYNLNVWSLLGFKLAIKFCGLNCLIALCRPTIVNSCVAFIIEMTCSIVLQQIRNVSKTGI